MSEDKFIKYYRKLLNGSLLILAYFTFRYLNDPMFWFLILGYLILLYRLFVIERLVTKARKKGLSVTEYLNHYTD
jgi:hypothetical protein